MPKEEQICAFDGNIEHLKINMKSILQRIKIAIVSIGILITFGILMHFLAYFSTYSSMFSIIMTVIMILAELAVGYIWLKRLHRELLVIKYKERKSDDRQTED